MHTVITGLGRTGTAWLAAMLAENTGARVAHEPFGPTDPRGLRRWRDGGPGIAVNSYARGMVELVDRTLLRPRWVVVVRDLVDVVASAVERPLVQARYSTYRHERYVVRSVARELLGDLEIALAELDRRRTAPAFWHFDTYTTAPGFVRFADSLGLDVADPPVMLPAKNRTGERSIPREVVDREAAYIRRALDAMPRCRAAYEAAANSGGA